MKRVFAATFVSVLLAVVAVQGQAGRLGQAVRRQDPEPVDAGGERQLESGERRNLVHRRRRVPALEADLHQFRDPGGLLGDSRRQQRHFHPLPGPGEGGSRHAVTK